MAKLRRTRVGQHPDQCWRNSRTANPSWPARHPADMERHCRTCQFFSIPTGKIARFEVPIHREGMAG